MASSMRSWCITAVLTVMVSGDADVGYELLVTSAGDRVARSCFKIPNIPDAAQGAFFIAGPGKFEMGGYSFESLFDGYGRMNRFELLADEVCYTAQLLNTSYFQHAEKLGRISNGPKFMGVEPPLPPCPYRNPLCFLTGAQIDNNWVNLMPAQGPLAPGYGQGLLLTDSPTIIGFDYETLAVTDFYPWKDGGMMPTWLNKHHVPALGSAHPVLRPKTEATWVEVLLEISMVPGVKDTLAVYTIDGKSMDRALLAHVPMKGAQYFHSFGVSEHYVVLPCNLRVGDPSLTGLVSMFRDGWDGIHVVDLNGKVQVFETEKFFHVHITNTFENETGIVIDLGTFEDIPFSPHVLSSEMYRNKTARDIKAKLNQVERMHLHLSGPMQGNVTREILSPPGRQTDFFKINEHKNGLHYCIYYGIEWFHDDKAYASMAVLKHDICRNRRTYWSKQDTYPSEPFFVPTGNAWGREDDGLLIFVALDGPRQVSDFVILNATSFEEVSVVNLPVHIPFLAHGQFVPKAPRGGVVDAADSKLAAAIGTTFTV